MLKRNCRRLMVVSSLLASAFVCASASAIDVREVVIETLKSNPRVLAEQREVDARGRQVRGALGAYYPTVDLAAGIGFQERDPSGTVFPGTPTRTRNELERAEAQISLRQLVFDGFNTRYEYRTQKAREESARQRSRSTSEDTSLEVVRVFTEVMKQRDTLALSQETLLFHQGVYDRMKKRFDSGIGSRADFDQISGRLALAQTNYQAASANLTDAESNYQWVVGLMPQTTELDSPGSYRNYLPGSLQEAIGKASVNHPIMKVADADVNATKTRYEQTKSVFYPQVYVDVERDLNDNIDGREGQVDDLRAMVRMRYNIYNGGSDSARRQEFAFLVEKAREIRRSALRQVEQELRLSWVAHETLKLQVSSLQAHAKDSSSTKAAYADQFDLGRRTLLDLLNTETENVNAKKSLIAGQYDLMYNEYRVFHSMGELMYMLGASKL